MWVKAKESTKIVVASPDMEASLYVQKDSAWIASFKPDENEYLPWIVNQGQLNIRISEISFRELFEEVIFLH